MSTRPENGNGGAGDNGAGADAPHFELQKIYVKDMSFEAPNAPEIYSEDQAGTQVNLNLKNSHQQLDDNVYEIVLHVSLHATLDDRTLFLIEIDQAGLFVIKGYTKGETGQLIAATCPATLYPYVREAVSATIGRGGFTSILLQPINFDALLAQAQVERAQT